MKRAQEEWSKRQKQLMAERDGGAKGGDAKGGAKAAVDAKPAEQEKEHPPMVLFFQPITLEELVNMVLNLAEYPTFSMMMRMKVQQMKVK